MFITAEKVNYILHFTTNIFFSAFFVLPEGFSGRKARKEPSFQMALLYAF